VKLRDQSVYEPPREVIIGFSFVDGEEVAMVDLTPSICIEATEWEVPPSRVFQPFTEEFEVVMIWLRAA
jgi:hypothetical protein